MADAHQYSISLWVTDLVTGQTEVLEVNRAENCKVDIDPTEERAEEQVITASPIIPTRLTPPSITITFDTVADDDDTYYTVTKKGPSHGS